ncbi:MAG: sporulation protein YqfD [Oscillospiraceae bacterium]|jgi:similar to stage IV sporulation protein|nr:sporulation protein YqfD [Oscillospiraceae bacterium]
MQQTVNFLRGSVEVDIEGAFPERFLNICAQNGIEFWGLRRLDDTHLRVRVHPSGWRAMPPFALKAQCRVSLVKQRGVPFFLWRYRRRHGFILGFLLTLGVLYGLSQFVWEFEVVGNELVSSETILRHLAEIGVKPGIYGPSIDIATIKNEMMLHIDELSWLTVNRQGSLATVEVRERIPKPEILPADQPCNIVAAKDGLILRVDARTGSAQVKAGETVTKGQLIVSGVVDSNLVGTRFLHAQADVYARTWYDLSAKMPLRVAAKTYTGRSYTRRILIVAGYRMNFSILGFPSFEKCDKIVKTATLGLPFGATLPVSLVTETYTEYKPAAASISQASAAEALKASLTRRLSALLDEGEVLAADVTAVESNGVLLVSLKAECREQIALTIPLPK